jgi:hypothetical protein
MIFMNVTSEIVGIVSVFRISIFTIEFRISSHIFKDNFTGTGVLPCEYSKLLSNPDVFQRSGFLTGSGFANTLY